jgi:hypothetical protein
MNSSIEESVSYMGTVVVIVSQTLNELTQRLSMYSMLLLVMVLALIYQK